MKSSYSSLYNGDVCEESRNRKYCDVLAAAKAGQRLLKAVNLLNNIFGSLPTFFLAWGLFVYNLTVLHDESKCKCLQKI